MKFPSLAEIRKFVVSVLGLAASALSLGLLHGTVSTVVTAVLGVATAAGVYAVPNAVLSSTPAKPSGS